jgi:hypothetical protein
MKHFPVIFMAQEFAEMDAVPFEKAVVKGLEQGTDDDHKEEYDRRGHEQDKPFFIVPE